MLAPDASKFKNQEDIYMTPTTQALCEHFKKHNSLTLYKKDGTPCTFEIAYGYVLIDQYEGHGFKTLDQLVEFCNKYGFSFKPVITSI